MAYTVAFNAANLIKGLNLQLEAAIAHAIQTTALTAQAAWQQTIMQTPGIWQPIRDRYAGSIQVEYSPGGMGARIYSDDPMATPIETGIPARDLKRMLDTSHKVRVTKTGQRYLIIPFRHNIPGNNALAGAMPDAIYAQAQHLTKSKITGQVSMRSGLNASDVRTQGPLMTMRNTYKWGGRLDGPDVAKRFKGMYRFDTSSGKQNYSSYMTFRVMKEGSSGWIIPAQPGRYIVKAVSEQAQQMLQTEVQSAIASVS
jgi:hypothetical protein